MIKSFKLFESEINEIDPYGEENWEGIEGLTPDTPINIGDTIYWSDGIELCTITRIEKDDEDDWIWGITSPESIQKGFVKETGNKELPYGRRNLTHSKLKIKHV